MKAIDKALSEIRHQIPPQVLEKVFTPVYDPRGSRQFYHNQGSIDAQIRQHVIESRCCVDTNLIGPEEMHIDLTGLEFSAIERFAATCHVPKSRTQGRRIITPLALVYGNNLTGHGTAPIASQYANHNTSTSTMGTAAARVGQAMMPIPDVQNSWCSLIGENVIAIEGYIPRLETATLRAIVAMDDELSTLPPAYYNAFAKLCVLATKAFIYNTYIIEMDAGELMSGRELGKFTEIVERYEAAEEDYQDYRANDWASHLRLSSPTKKARYIKMLTGNMG